MSAIGSLNIGTCKRMKLQRKEKHKFEHIKNYPYNNMDGATLDPSKYLLKRHLACMRGHA